MDTPSGAMVARAILLCCSVDLPARAMITNMKQFNRKHGCLYCEDEGTVIGSDHLHRYWPQKTSCTPRTHQSVLSNEDIICKCLFLDFDSVKYVFPSSMMFD